MHQKKRAPQKRQQGKRPYQKKQAAQERNLDPIVHTDKGGLYMCHYCTDLFSKRHITKDHKLAKSDGGANHKKNYVPSCQPCNWLKADIPYEKFKQIVDEFGTDITRFETPHSATNHIIVENGLVYNLLSGKPKASNNEEVGFGSRILTTVTVKTKLYIFVSKKYGKRKE
jgi:hypothetical protein